MLYSMFTVQVLKSQGILVHRTSNIAWAKLSPIKFTTTGASLSLGTKKPRLQNGGSKKFMEKSKLTSQITRYSSTHEVTYLN